MKTLLRSFFVLLLFCTVSNAQWVEQNSGTTQAIYAVSAVDNNVCWMGGTGGVVLRTIDGGTTWTNVGGGAIGTALVFNIFAWDSSFALCTTTPGANTYVYRTTNGGANWTQVFQQRNGFIDNIWLWSITDGFMNGDPVNSRWSNWRTTNGGITWDSTGLYLPAMSGEAGYINSMYVNGSEMYFGTNVNKVYYSSNNGNSWVAQQVPLTNSFIIWFNSPSLGFAAGESEGLIFTTNGGTTWSSVTMPTGFGKISRLTGLDNLLYCIDFTYAQIIKSTDSGSSWSLEYTVSAGQYSSQIVKARNGDVVWIGRTDGGITKGTNLGLPVELTSFTGSFNGIEVTLNWSTATELNNYGFEVQRKALNGDFSTIAFVEGQGTTTKKHDYSYVDKNLDAGKYSYRLKQVDLNGKFEYSKIVEVEVISIASYSLEQNYPNPFNPTTTIGYVLQEKGNARLTMLNSIGEEIGLLVNEEQDKGYHSLEFDAVNLPSGVYFYQLKSGSFIETKKMILLR